MAAEPKKLTVEGWVAKEVWQHMVDPQPGRRMEAFDTLGGGQLVVYVKEPLPEGQLLRLEGNELMLEGKGKRPGSTERFTERQLIVETWQPLKDAALEGLATALPKGWSMTLAPPLLTLERKGEVFVLHENRLNAAPEKAEARAARVRAHGTKSTCRLVFRLEAVWSAEKRAKATNPPDTAPSEQPISIRPNRKAPITAPPPATRPAPQARRVVLPEGQSTWFSLLLVESEGLEGESASVEPAEAARETHGVLEQVRALK